MNSVKQRYQVAALRFRRRAGRILSKFCLIPPQQQFTLFFQAVDSCRVERCVRMHTLVYAFSVSKVLFKGRKERKSRELATSSPKADSAAESIQPRSALGIVRLPTLATGDSRPITMEPGQLKDSGIGKLRKIAQFCYV